MYYREPSMTDKHVIQDVLSQYVRAIAVTAGTPTPRRVVRQKVSGRQFKSA